MFNKPKNNPPAPAKASNQPPIPPLPDLPSPGQKSAGEPTQAVTPTPAAPPSRGSSVLSRDLAFEGNVSGQGEFQIDGQVKGDVRVGRLIVGETGSIEGSVQAENVEVRGRVVGAVTGKVVRLHGTAYVDGDINHEQLSIEVGAYFQGRCLQSRPGQAAPSAAAPTPPAAAAQPAATAAPAADTAEVVTLKPGA